MIPEQLKEILKSEIAKSKAFEKLAPERYGEVTEAFKRLLNKFAKDDFADMVVVRDSKDRMEVAAILVKNGYQVRQSRRRKPGSKSAFEYVLLFEEVTGDVPDDS